MKNVYATTRPFSGFFVIFLCLVFFSTSRYKVRSLSIQYILVVIRSYLLPRRGRKTHRKKEDRERERESREIYCRIERSTEKAERKRNETQKNKKNRENLFSLLFSAYRFFVFVIHCLYPHLILDILYIICFICCFCSCSCRIERTVVQRRGKKKKRKRTEQNYQHREKTDFCFVFHFLSVSTILW